MKPHEFSTVFTFVLEYFQIYLILDRYSGIFLTLSCVLRTSVVVFLLIWHGINSHSDLSLMDVCGEQDGLRFYLVTVINLGQTEKRKRLFHSGKKNSNTENYVRRCGALFSC